MKHKKLDIKYFFKIWTGIIGTGLLLMLGKYITPLLTETPSLQLLINILIFTLISGSILFYYFKKFQSIENRLYNVSMEDELTNLKNMRYFKNRFQEVLSFSKRHNKQFALILFDLDNFKNYNDHYGHRAGDNLIKQMSHFFQERVRFEETLARYGGDEFILLLPKADINEAEKTAERLCRELKSTTFEIKDNEISLNISSGIAIYPEDGKNMETLIDIADENLYQAKKANKDVCSSNNKNDFNSISTPVSSLLVKDKDEYIDKVAKETTQLYLLAKNQNIEIIKQNITAEKRFQIELQKENNFEFFYILEGKILYTGDNKVLTPGDYITAQGITEETYFKTLTDVTVLYITQIAVFESEQEQIQNLLSLNKEVAEKDHQTNEHCKRLQKLSKLTGEKLDLDEKQLFCLGYASFLHDIGKAKLPSSLITKPGKLSDEEWEQMKKHTKWGYELIVEHLSSSTFKRVAEIVHQHHEHYDGNGYPQGLAGEDILIEAQILSTVDAYDAMTYNRPYQKAIPREEARKELKSEKEKQFAPRVIDAFLEVEKEIYKKNPDKKLINA